MKINPLASSSKGNAYKITSTGFRPLLLDCGIKFNDLNKLLGFKSHELCGCLITHEHTDHMTSVKALLLRGIKCYMSRGTADKLGVSGHGVIIVKDEQQFTVGGWHVVALATKHDAAEPLAFRVLDDKHDLFYLTDSAYTSYKIDGVTHLLVECNYVVEILEKNINNGSIHGSRKKRLLESHMSLETVKKMLKDSDISSLKEIHLCHLSDSNSDEKRMIRELQLLTGLPVWACRA